MTYTIVIEEEVEDRAEVIALLKHVSKQVKGGITSSADPKWHIVEKGVPKNDAICCECLVRHYKGQKCRWY